MLLLIATTNIVNICVTTKSFTSFNTNLRIHTFYGGARMVILYNLSSAKCSNTAYGAKPSRTSIECSVQVDDLFIN